GAIGVQVGLAAVHRIRVAIVESHVAGHGALAAVAARGGVGPGGARHGAATAVLEIGGRVDLAAVGELLVAVGEPRVARGQRAGGGDARGGAVGGRGAGLGAAAAVGGVRRGVGAGAVAAH